MEEKLNKDLTLWKTIAGVLGVFVLSLTSMWGLIQVHASQTHPGGVARTEYTARNTSIDDRLKRIESKVDFLVERKN